MSVVPPPMSSRQTPRSFSSSDSTARAEASGCRIRSCTSSPQRRTHLMMFCAADTAPVTMCTFTSRRTPDMPIGSRTSSWPSMMNSWRSTCRICWSVGMLTARAVSTARSTSSAPTSRSLIATMPVELKLRMWLPAMPTKAAVIFVSAISSASSSARCTAPTVASMFTTTPFFRPFDSWPPMPRISSTPSGRSSATRQATFEVPMSSATIRFLFSFGIRSASQLRHAQREAVRIAQVQVLVLARHGLQRRVVRRDEAFQARLGLVAIAAEHDLQPVVEPELPGEARGQHHALGLHAERREQRLEAGVAQRDLGLGPGRTDEQRQCSVRSAAEGLAVGVDQRIASPARERDVLFQADFEAVRPHLAHGYAPHPGQLLQPLAHRGRLDGEEVAGDAAARRALDLLLRGLAERRYDVKLAHRQVRRAQRELQQRDAEDQRRDADQRAGEEVELARVIPHGPSPGCARRDPRTGCRRPSPPSAPGCARSCRARCSLRAARACRACPA